MSISVKCNRVHIAASKVRLVCDLVRNKKASEALTLLRFNEKKEIALVLTKLINSGLAIATNSSQYDLDNLVLSKLVVNEGPTLARIQARARGRAFRIRKRTSHIMLEIKEA